MHDYMIYGKTRFYFRSPGTDTAPDYCRQLVYTADNKLRDGKVATNVVFDSLSSLCCVV